MKFSEILPAASQQILQYKVDEIALYQRGNHIFKSLWFRPDGKQFLRIQTFMTIFGHVLSRLRILVIGVEKLLENKLLVKTI